MFEGAVGHHLAVGTCVPRSKVLPLANYRSVGCIRRHRLAVPGLRQPLGTTRFATVSRAGSATSVCSIRAAAAGPGATSSSRCNISSKPSRQLVIAAAGRRPKSDQPAAVDGDSSQLDITNLSSLTLPELKQVCQELGVPKTGKKGDLIARIQEQLQQQQQQEEEPAESAPPAAAASTPAAADEDSAADMDLEELIIELEAEFAGHPKQELVAALQSKGLPTDGKKDELVQRLAEAVAQEELGIEAAAATPPPAAAVPQQQQEPAQQKPAGSSSTNAADREWLIADKQQAMLEDLLQMGVKREELVEILAEMGQTATEDETLEELADRASWVLAEEDVLLMEQQAAAGTAAAPEAAPTAGQQALANSPSSVLDGLTATDINKMKVDDLKSMLRQLGLSDEGGRYVLRDRLMTMLVVRKAATAGDMDQLLAQLSQMTLTELRSELERRDVSLSGSKAALEMRLAQALVVEIMGGDAAAAAMQMQMGTAPQDEDEVDDLGNPLLEDYDEIETAIVDPLVRVALICGVAPATSTASSNISASAKLRKVTEALATAATLIDELHTAPLDPDQAAAMLAGPDPAAAIAEVAAAAGITTAAEEGSEPAAADGEDDELVPEAPRCGILVDCYWANSDGVFYLLPAAAVCGMAPADLAARPHQFAVASFQNVETLAQKLADSKVRAALSVLPGGALAMSGQLASACESAGVLLAAGGPSDSTENDALSAGREPVLGGRSAVLQELQSLGYPTLPILEVSRQDLLDNALDVAKYLDNVLGEEEAAYLGPDDSEAPPLVDDNDESGPPKSSAILRAWNAAAVTDHGVQAPPAAAVAPAAAAETSDVPQQQQEGESAAADQEADPYADMPDVVRSIVTWCETQGCDPELQLFMIGNAAGGEPLAAARGVQRIVEQLVAVFALDDSVTSLLVEPFYRKLARWDVIVVSTAEDGPVALVPAELEHYHILDEITDAGLALKEWGMLQEGMEEEAISSLLEAMSSQEPQNVDTLRLPALPDPMPGYQLKLHMPPRASTKITQTIRHAAAKAVAELGLERAGVVRVSGWMALKPNWQDIYTLAPEDIKKMPDWDGGQLLRMYEDELALRVNEPSPLVEYYDDETHMPDLTKFDQATRCTAEGNGEGDVLLSSVELDVPLHSTSIAGIQALETGLGLGGLARHLINLALLRKDPDPEQLLPPPTPPLTIYSAQWAQATGANDNSEDITMQLAVEKVEERDALDYARERAAVEEQRKVFAALPLDDAVKDVLQALTAEHMTEEELNAPAQDPEEWQPEFDTRSQEEINAERDALRAPEDLAARDLRDEGLPHYGDQPIRYDRFDLGDDWKPPAILAAEATAAGQPVPSIADLQKVEEEKQDRSRQQILAGPYSEDDRLPDVSEDEVLYYRLLDRDRYKGGVQSSMQQTRDWQRDSRTQIASAAQQAAEEAVRSGGAITGPAAAALKGVVGGTPPVDNWPYPSDRELQAEIDSRQAAPRVWVLMGGDGLDRQRCFRNGANIVAKLSRCQDIQVDAFLLPPAGAGVDEVKRRAALLARRTEWQALGIPEDIYPESMSDAALVDMPPTETPALCRSITVMGPHHLARHTVEEAIESAERVAARSRISYASVPVVERHQLDSQLDSQMELDAHYVEGVGSSWGGVAAHVLPPPPRTMNVEEFILEGASCGATVILATDDSITTSGQLQQYLEAAGIGYTGMTSDFAFKCSNRLATSKAIDDIVHNLAIAAGYSEEDIKAHQQEHTDMLSTSLVGLYAMPKKVIKTQELLLEMERPGGPDISIAGLFDGWDCKSVVLKPPAHSSGMGNIRIATADDLVVATQAMREAAPKVLPHRLSLQPEGVTLPLSLPDLLVVEPWVETDTVGFSAAGDEGAGVQWAGSSRWVEVTVGLVGELGSMVALPLTMLAHGPEGGVHLLTPAPQHILSQQVAEAVQGYAVAVADGLGLRSIASVDGFVNVDSGEMIVMDVKPNPPLTDGSPIFQQAMLLDPPMLPYQLFRNLARDAFLSAVAAAEAEATDLPSGGSAYYAPGEAGTAGFTAEDFDLGGGDDASADLFAGPGSAGYGDDAVEDEDMQGLAAGWSR